MSGTVSVVDNIITNHSVGLERTSGTVFENFNLFFGSSTPVSGTLVAGSGANDLIGSNPLFVSPAADDYHLSLGSPAIDRGSDVLVNIDFDGDPRPIGAGFDIGFDERNGAAFKVYLPLVVR